MKGTRPDVVFFGGMDAVADPMLRQMKQLGIEAKFLSGDGICTGELPKLAAGTVGDGRAHSVMLAGQKSCAVSKTSTSLGPK